MRQIQWVTFSVSWFLLLNIVFLFGACKKEGKVVLDATVNPFQSVDSDFVFFPKKNAKWIISSYLKAQINPTTVATANFIDTFYIGIDTLMDVWIYSTDSAKNVQRPIRYTELMSSTFVTYPGTPNTEYLKRRYGWFRQDVSKRKIYGPLTTAGIGTSDILLMDFSLKVGEKLPFGNIGAVYPSVTSVDSIKFGEGYLRSLQCSPAAIRSPDIVQGRDFFAVVNPYFHGATAWVWGKFIYKQDTLTTYY